MRTRVYMLEAEANQRNELQFTHMQTFGIRATQRVSTKTMLDCLDYTYLVYTEYKVGWDGY